MEKPVFILASASPRRLSLLASIGIAPDRVVAPDIDETPRPHEAPRALAQRLALEKLRAVAAAEPQAFVLAADTVVGCGRRILPKAENAAQVRECLALLSGRRHHVYTGLALQTPSGKIIQRLCDSVVIFQRLDAAMIEAYVAQGEGIGKAGGYAVQGRAAGFTRFISGSHSNIVGLSLFDVAQMLRQGGYPL